MTGTSTSLLARLRNPADSSAWRRLSDLYTPLIRAWLSRQLPQEADIDDVAQQVFTVVVEKHGQFEHNGRAGAFRTWLRTICINRVRMFWRSHPTSGPDPELILQQLEDPQSQLSQHWDREHDEFVFRRVVELIESEFKQATWQAFRKVALDGQPAEAVATELGLSVNAVFIAKSRVLRRLREEIEGLV